jgi:hypothetical protein
VALPIAVACRIADQRLDAARRCGLCPRLDAGARGRQRQGNEQDRASAEPLPVSARGGRRARVGSIDGPHGSDGCAIAALRQVPCAGFAAPAQEKEPLESGSSPARAKGQWLSTNTIVEPIEALEGSV